MRMLSAPVIVMMLANLGGTRQPRPALKGVTQMRRLLSLLAVSALMVAMLVAMATPAFAAQYYLAKGEANCGEKGSSLEGPAGSVDFITSPSFNAGGHGQGLQIHSCPANSPVGQR